MFNIDNYQMKKLYSLIAETKTKSFEYEPSFYRLSKEEDKQALEKLLETPGLMVFDELNNQLRELIKVKNPTVKFDETNRTLMENYVQNHMGATIHMNYGVWVYYPWSNKLVHILDEEEYIQLRTNRNKYKITDEEQQELSMKKVGVVGLSVGQSVALTMAMERSFGELRIADFDILELTNYNRIRTGIHNIEISKCIAVAREIAEIDPFLRVICYPEGINEENLDDFLSENGQLNVLIDECDSLDIKIKLRNKARELKIPVLMDTSDRGMLDIERFDLEPTRDLFHGLAGSNNIKKPKTQQEFFEMAMKIIGKDTMSKRMKDSIDEVGKSITTWPQLAASVILGGGVTAEAYRKIALGKNIASGRYYFDFDEIISYN